MGDRLVTILADLLRLVHFGFVLFVVAGLGCVLVGKFRNWRWVRDPWFRLAHLLAIGFVAVQAWLGRLCPLTIWESALRRAAGGDAYEGSFVAHWIGRILYFEAPLWVFAVAYTLFGALVVASWWIVPPRPFTRRARR